MTHNGHLDARTLHARLNHPVIDADGHWLEDSPVMREEFRRIGGDAAAEALGPPGHGGAAAVEGLAVASGGVQSSLKWRVSERPRGRVGQEAFWCSACENVLDR